MADLHWQKHLEKINSGKRDSDVLVLFDKVEDTKNCPEHHLRVLLEGVFQGLSEAPRSEEDVEVTRRDFGTEDSLYLVDIP